MVNSGWRWDCPRPAVLNPDLLALHHMHCFPICRGRVFDEFVTVGEVVSGEPVVGHGNEHGGKMLGGLGKLPIAIQLDPLLMMLQPGWCRLAVAAFSEDGKDFQ